jgi:hypothetical protein
MIGRDLVREHVEDSVIVWKMSPSLRYSELGSLVPLVRNRVSCITSTNAVDANSIGVRNWTN